MKKLNILVTGAGGDIGISVGKCLKHEGVNSLVGCDILSEHPGVVFFDKTEVVKRADSDDYLESMSTVIKKHSIDIVIPTAEPELRILCKKKIEKIGKTPVLHILGKATDIGYDKLETAKFIKSIGLESPWTVLASNEPKELPCFFKPRFAAGSKNISVVEDKALSRFEGFGEDYVFQELLLPDEEEYTCGLYRSKTGEIRDIIFRRKLRGDFTGQGQVVVDKEISDVLHKIAKEFDLRGSINVQLRKTERGPVVFEINPRFSSTVFFRHMLGFKDVIWSLQEHFGTEISDYTPAPEGAKIYKLQKEYVILKDKIMEG